MTLELLRAALDADRSVSDWRIVEARRSGTEWYVVGADLDMARSVEAVDYRLTVYADAGEAGSPRRGEATVSVHPTMGAAEIEALVSRAAAAAARSRNPWYPLPERAEWTPHPASGFEGKGGAAWMPQLLDALRFASVEGARINSLEIFLARAQSRILNSRGVDASFAFWRGDVEHTVEASGPSGDVEMTESFSFSEPDLGLLAGELARALALARDRARAEPMEAAEGLPLILSGRCAEETLRWFFDNLDGARIFSGASPLELGEPLHGPDAGPDDYDPLDIAAESFLAGAAGSAPLDAEGIPLGRAELSRGGIAAEYHGLSRYARYLGRRPCGAYALFSVGPGAMTTAQLRSRPHIEAAAFSSYDVDADTGDFGGEVRLAYVFDGSERRPVTGGSITGSLLENRGRLRLSSEIALSGAMLGPEALLLPSVSIAGIK
jgi:predicted Zn-dependent protease